MKKTILSGSQLSLAVEGRTTNLQIWTSKNDETIYFRLDKFQNYSATLSDESVNYLEKRNEVVIKLNMLFGFNRATKNDIDTIIEIIKDMKIRECISW